MFKKMFRWSIPLLWCAATSVAYGQLQLGIQTGRNSFGGDAYGWRQVPQKKILNTGSANGVYARYLFNDRRFGARLQYAYIPLNFDERQLTGSHIARGFSGSNEASDISLDLSWYLWRNYRVSPYLFGGIGGQISNYKVNWGSEDNKTALATQIAQDQKAPKVNFTLPVGGGLRVRLTERLAATLETAIRLPISDYYDGISKAANPNANDWYGYGMLGLNFIPRGMPDRDGDGISDKRDACPDVAGIKLFKGCPDTDGDGIVDSEDKCPIEKGSVAMKGCPDTDGDGVANAEDKCPDVLGKADLMGCPDRDDDGVADILDGCPDDKGLVDLGGCPDKDGDMIADKEDECPDEKGEMAFKGCPDSDKDGIADKLDKCPTEAGVASTQGCPLPDADKDGIADAEDKCPSIAGKSQYKGCPDTISLINSWGSRIMEGNSTVVDNQRVLTQQVQLSGTSEGRVVETESQAGRIVTKTTESTTISVPAQTISSETVQTEAGRVVTKVTESTSTTTVPTQTMSSETVQTEAGRVVTKVTESTSTTAAPTQTMPSETVQTEAGRVVTKVTESISTTAAPVQTMPSETVQTEAGRVVTKVTESAPIVPAPVQTIPSETVQTEVGRVVTKVTESAPIVPAPVQTMPSEISAKSGELISGKKPLEPPTPSIGMSGNTGNVTTTSQSTRSTSRCAACSQSNDPIFTSVCENPKKLEKLGTNPEFGNSHGLTPEQFYNKLKKAYNANSVDKTFLDRIYKAMGYTGFADATPEQFSEVTLPMGSTGKLGYHPTHKTGCYTLPDDEYHRLAFKINATNGCDIHFMKTCGNHFFFCPSE